MKAEVGFSLSTALIDIDRDFVVREIGNSYWAVGRTKEQILTSLEHSYCLSSFQDGKQIGFLRVVTDYSTFAYLCDVVVEENSRGQGIGQKMLTEVFSDPRFEKVKWVLRTKDAHTLYEKFGFYLTQRSERYMEKNN